MPQSAYGVLLGTSDVVSIWCPVSSGIEDKGGQMTGSPEKAVQVRMFMLISHIQLKPCNGSAFRNVRVSNPSLSATQSVSQRKFADLSSKYAEDARIP